jgi:hypothetical protein
LRAKRIATTRYGPEFARARIIDPNTIAIAARSPPVDWRHLHGFRDGGDAADAMAGRFWAPRYFGTDRRPHSIYAW